MEKKKTHFLFVGETERQITAGMKMHWFHICILFVTSQNVEENYAKVKTQFKCLLG